MGVIVGAGRYAEIVNRLTERVDGQRRRVERLAERTWAALDAADPRIMRHRMYAVPAPDAMERPTS